ncbi:MAG: phosphatidylserine/phosphatidylglycerophosphate/cardiolipin synthase family protein [Candidatus Polarisedimenticolaceae bacterium]|nr:phosphatidylserine/phosphatidylglycerophosphate/cardiolipin synthase family protein [Candidatus Polarisedimenticolaceae bacterium]
MRKKQRLDYFPWRERSQLALLLDGSSFFPEISSAIESAQSYICIELYLMRSGKVADNFIRLLNRAAERGVEVYLLLDDYGSLGLNDADREQLENGKINLVFYNPLRPRSNLRILYRILWRKVGYDLHRDHRKLVLVDGRVAFIGGFGFTDDFLPSNNEASGWRENVLKIEGEIVTDLNKLFTQAWSRYSSFPINLFIPTPRVEHHEKGCRARVAYSEGGINDDIKRQSLNRITNAKSHIWLCTAYFLPSWRYLRRLRHAARNGVEVRLLLPGPLTDHPVVRYAGQRHYSRLLRNGVRIFEYQPRVLHAKSLLCDDWGFLGSNNFDHWGLNWNLEANIEIDDVVFSHRVRGMFESDFQQSIEITRDNWRHRGWFHRVTENIMGRVDKWVILITNRLRR